jgi:hypothetical protein
MLVLAGSAGAGQERKSPPAAKLVRPEVFYAQGEALKDKVRLSDEMAAKIIEIVGRKPTPFKRDIKAAPRGYFLVGEKVYCFYGGITSDPAEGDSWTDPALGRFWNELNRVKDQLEPLKDFKP